MAPPAGAALAVVLAALPLLSLASGCSGATARAGSELPGPAATPAQPSTPLLERAQQELMLTRDALEELARESHLVLDAALGAQLAHVRKELGWLLRKAPEWQPSTSVAELAKALAEHRALLAELRQLPSTDARLLLSALLRDVEIKAQQCRRFGGPVPVNVSVVTRDAAQREVAGYEVWFVRKAQERKPHAPRRFDRYSSPAGRVFDEAGYYVLWAVPPGQSPVAAAEQSPPTSPGQHRAGAARYSGISSSRLDVEVGASALEQVIDLLAPVAPPAEPVGFMSGAATLPGVLSGVPLPGAD